MDTVSHNPVTKTK